MIFLSISPINLYIFKLFIYLKIKLSSVESKREYLRFINFCHNIHIKNVETHISNEILNTLRIIVSVIRDNKKRSSLQNAYYIEFHYFSVRRVKNRKSILHVSAIRTSKTYLSMSRCFVCWVRIRKFISSQLYRCQWCHFPLTFRL